MILLDVMGTGAAVERVVTSLLEQGTQLGLTILKALVIFIIGRWIVKLLNKLVARILSKRNVDPSVKSFVGSMVNICLMILLIISVIAALGVETTSFAALLASVGVAVGMALSGNLSNFAGGLIILLLRPYKVGDYIEAQGVSGTVDSIEIFHTVMLTPDNKVIYVANGALSSGTIINYSNKDTRRVDWAFNMSYGSDFDQLKQVIESVLAKDKRILSDPATFVAVTALTENNVNVTIRGWVDSANYWDVYFDTYKELYKTFKEKGIDFPCPQIAVRQAK